MGTRERLHQLIDLLPEEETSKALQLIERLSSDDLPEWEKILDQMALEMTPEEAEKMPTTVELGAPMPMIPVDKRVSGLGKFAHLPVSSEGFMQRKREEIEREEKRSERWRSDPR